MRQEVFKVLMISNGQLTSWGKGEYGELGLDLMSYGNRSGLFPGFEHCHNANSQRRHHVLAIDHEKRLYSWGSGAFGKLGHGDLYNRYSPTSVDFFLRYNVECIAAGDNHSACLTTTRKSEAPRRLSSCAECLAGAKALTAALVTAAIS